MILLPVVERELRVASRRRATYVWRVIAVGVALTLGGWMMLTLPELTPTSEKGTQLFQALSWFAVIQALVSGTKATADCLSSEKRQGTLGLLFLTDLKGRDVIFGKLAATSLDTCYGILGLMPVLAIPMLMGGVTAGEFWRMVLIMPGLLLFGLSCGIFASSLSYVERKAMGAAFLIMAASNLGIWLMRIAVDNASNFAPFLVLSPTRSCWSAFEANYTSAPRDYWVSMGFTLGLSSLLLFITSRTVTRVWSDRPRVARSGWREKWRARIRGSAGIRERYRTCLLNMNPVLWLSIRERHLCSYPWIFMGSTLAVLSMGFFIEHNTAWLESTVVTFYVVHFIFKYWLATFVCEGLSADRDQGALEVILSTPLRVSEIVRGQWLGVRRFFGWPFLALVIVEIVLVSWATMAKRYAPDNVTWVVFAGFGAVLLFADCFAIGALGMWRGVRARTPHAAASSTLIVVLALPSLLLAILATVAGVLEVDHLSELFWTTSWLLLGLVTDLVVILWAHRKYEPNLRRAVSERYASATTRRRAEEPGKP